MRDYIYEIIIGKKRGVAAFAIKLILLPLSLIFGFIVSIIKLLYSLKILKTTRLNCTVISVGNITWGGTGKTPLVELVASRLKSKGRRVAILSRGYKSADEPGLLAKNLMDVPILTGRNRIKSAKAAIAKYNVDTIILDDGFQHWRLFRDLDIVAINAANPFGNRQLIPLGILREPVGALRRADIFVLTKTDLNTGLDTLSSLLCRVNPHALLVKSVHEISGFFRQGGGLVDASILREKPVAVLSGVADPESFEKMIKNLGINIGLSFRFPDHHNYTKEDIDAVRQDCLSQNIPTIITTEKDAVKLRDHLNYLVLKIKVKITQDEAFFKRISTLY